MKRGFLLGGSKPHKSLASGVAIAQDKPQGTFKIPAMPVFENIQQIGRLPVGNPYNMIVTRFPFHCALEEPYSIFVLYPGGREAISAIPGLPSPYTPSPRVHYRIGDAPGAGKGMFALTDLDTGDLILREIPWLLLPGCIVGNRATVDTVLMKVLATAMMPEDFAEFFKLANCKTEGSSISGIMNTNAHSAGRMPGAYDGSYGGICRDLSRVNHRSVPPRGLTRSLTIV